jgi:hypothetical protein
MVTLITAVKSPLSYATLALLLIAGLSYYAVEPLLAVVLLAAYTIVILAIFLRSERSATAEPGLAIRWYPNIQAVYPDMSSLIDDSIRSEGRTSVEVMGLTLYHMWEYLRNFLNKETVKNLDIRLTAIAGTLQQTEWFKTNWAELSRGFCRAIADYRCANSEELERRGIRICVHLYDHLPMFHGILINREHLFLSFTSWSKQGRIEGGTTFYCYYNTKTEIGKLHVRIFKAWLTHIEKEHPHETGKVNGAEQGAAPDGDSGALHPRQ